jgi:hypothetical protein
MAAHKRRLGKYVHFDTNTMKNTGGIFHSHRKAGVYLLAFGLSVLSGLLCGTTEAGTVPRDHAHRVIKTWLAENARPMGSRLGSEVDSDETFTDADGQPVYYVVYLRPNGFVIVPADDEIEPIICFVSEGSYDPSDRNPLGALVSRDLPARVDAVRTVRMKALSGRTAVSLTEKETAVRESAENASGKWAKLLSQTDVPPVSAKSIAGVSDIRVAPLVQSKWSQTTVGGKACYNYYTPPYSEGNANNYYCGCVATAMAQYMKFWQYPTAGVGTDSFTIRVDNVPQSRSLRGGDGSGGVYNWSQMPLVPGSSETQRQAIGALTYDAGVAVEMSYEADGSAAYLSDAADALINTFHYSNAIFGFSTGNIGAGLNGMINPNLDNGNPVILGISGSDVGHAIVADGYGYQGSTLYHHLNLGWSGLYDAWYNLPTINASYSFNIVDNAIYNIYTSGTGEIISGRVTVTGSNLPISGVTVTASKSGGGTYQTTTNTKGIYAIANVPSNSTYTMSAVKSGYSFAADEAASTGQSQDYEDVSGNCWAINFTGVVAGPIPVASDSNVTAELQTPTTITLQAFDDGQPKPPGALTYIITLLPRHGTLTDPSAGDITTVPYSLVSHGKNVTYTSTSLNYTGPDSFQFKVNDSGSPPTGGDSTVAAVRVTVQPPSPEVIYETGFNGGLPAGWTIVDGGNDGYTWQSDNPGGRSSAYWTDTFMIVDSDDAGIADMNEQLITHSINCTNLTGVKLRFKHYFNDYSYSSETGDVDVRVNGGAWRNVKRYRGADYEGLVELALSNFGADGSPGVQIRWHYYNARDCWYWGIDDVQIIASEDVPAVSVAKCTVTAGSKPNSDKISFSGQMNPAADLNDANFIMVTIFSDDINAPCDQNFPIDYKTFKNGKYNYSGTNGIIRKSLTYDLKTRKFAFSASKVDLSGLGCPLTVEVEVGDYNSTTDADEMIANGPKVPIPMLLMMGVKDVLRVDKPYDKCQVKHGKDPNTDQLTVKGALAVEEADVNTANMITEDLVITLDSQQFTIPKGKLKAAKGKFTICPKAYISDNEGGIATGEFNFNLCSFTLTIKNTNIDPVSGTVDFGVSFKGFDQVDQVTLP